MKATVLSCGECGETFSISDAGLSLRELIERGEVPEGHAWGIGDCDLRHVKVTKNSPYRRED